MGQTPSNSVQTSAYKFIPDSIDVVHEEIYRHARFLSEIALLSYEDFLIDLGKINTMSKKYFSAEGKEIVFAVKRGTDSSVLWKGTVKVACIKFDPKSKKIDTYRLLTLVEFLRVLKTLENQLIAAEQTKSSLSETEELTTSTLMNTLKSITNQDTQQPECCICLERKPEVTLPCAHSYCKICIEQWNVYHKTCPICRETLETTDDTWVLSEVPEAEEINKEIRASLMQLVDEPSNN